MDDGYFCGKKILVTGGTGSIGSRVVDALARTDASLVRIYSRDEYKQHRLRYRYRDIGCLDYVLGDVRDRDSLVSASRGMDIIFHCAALKHVPVSEEMPEEFIKTNILGSLNVKKSAMENQVPLTVSVSSDKAVESSNLMGLSKAVQEKIFTSHFVRERLPSIRFVTVRFGNVIGTHGSLFPIIYHQILRNEPITVTEPSMTRFYMSLDEAVSLIFWAARYGKDGEIAIKKMKSTRIDRLVSLFLRTLNKPEQYPTKQIGVRVGEKMHESLITEDEQYRIREERENYIIAPYSKGEIRVNAMPHESVERRKFFSSNVENFLTDEEIVKYINDFLLGHREGEKDII